MHKSYSGSMVADVHHNLLKGGIFMYHATVDKPPRQIRLQYECFIGNEKSQKGRWKGVAPVGYTNKITEMEKNILLL